MCLCYLKRHAVLSLLFSEQGVLGPGKGLDELAHQLRKAWTTCKNTALSLCGPLVMDSEVCAPPALLPPFSSNSSWIDLLFPSRSLPSPSFQFPSFFHRPPPLSLPRFLKNASMSVKYGATGLSAPSAGLRGRGGQVCERDSRPTGATCGGVRGSGLRTRVAVTTTGQAAKERRLSGAE